MKSENILTLLLSALIGYLLYLIMAPFLTPIFWAIVLVILFFPYFRWIQKHIVKSKPWASLLACVSIALFLILPMAFIGAALVNELYNLYQWAENYLADITSRAHQTPVFIFPYLEKYLGKYIDVSSIDLRNIFANTLREVATVAGEGIKGFIKSFAELIVNLFLAFFTMYFLFKDGDKLLNLVKDLMPISKHDRDRIIEKNRDVISSTMYGGVLVGVVQGALGGIAFFFLDLPGPLLWGFVMFIFSFLPSVGTAMIWGPAVIYLLIIGSYGKGIFLAIWGTFVIGLVDNLLRPYIVSGKTNLHPMLLFFSILGAVNVFGFIGVIAGPVILSIAQAVIEIYHEYVKNKNTWAG